MSDEGEKTCPLCAEEMDLTDQQLKPCKCGYDICVWCWHHIMDMAEKDATEGRCPACRTPYNKEKIVSTTSKCERLVAEMSVEKKHKSQKGKSKTSEGRKQLSSVRVIQRNLVYVMGLPLSLADEDLLQRKEYFGRYGKVLKVSISRTAAGAIQQFANNTCSVYITYSKEDEAVRSIQSVHGFILEGRPLRACFGTTKYCHAWLRSMPCTNPDCLYLHEFGSQEDSFTKDEIISEYTRGRVQQVTAATNEMQCRSGNTLPPAADDYSYNSTSLAKPISKSTTNVRYLVLTFFLLFSYKFSMSSKSILMDQTNSKKSSPPNSSSGRSEALPAAASWGTRVTNNQSVAASVLSSKGPSKQKVDTCTSLSFSTAVVGPSSFSNEIPKKHSEESPSADGKRKQENLESPKRVRGTDYRKTVSEIPTIDNDLDQLSSDMSSVSIGKNHALQPCDDEQPFISNKAKVDTNSTMDDYVTEHKVAIKEVEDDLSSFNDQRLRDPEVVTHTHTGYVHNTPQSSDMNNFVGHTYSPQQQYVSANVSNGDHRNALDQGEDSIISDILSWDFDPWDESLTSPQNLTKLLSESDKQHGSQSVATLRKTHSCNQSRFSFAREDDECVDGGSNFTHNLRDLGSGVSQQNLNRDYAGQLSNGNGFSSFNYEESDRTASNHSFLSSNKIPATRSQISAPPGFMGPSRAPPPGFTSNERMERTYDILSGNHMFDTSSLMRKVHQAPTQPVYNGSVSELEFMDPAILAVGGRIPGGVTSPGLDMRSNFPSSFETDNRLRHLAQRSFIEKNQRFSDLGDNLSYSQRTDSYGVPSRFVEPNNRSAYQGNFQQPRISNGHWDDIAMAELLRNERLGYNKYYSSYEDTKFRVPSSGDLYSRNFGI
ncbi:uncharacterized protein [Rutidosis leptorrhynchoides]|uniref:uncharacterized protein n=1 Tax=Rutidosis leptorrhynchoides TaxID=125765 RepID=UPI003A99D64A